MTYAPVIPATGALGWAFLKRTATAQQATLAKSPEVQRDADYFRARIGKVDTADQLVADRRLLRITLEAYGLEADLDSRAFIRKVLADGTLKTGALAMKLADPRYKALTEAFGFGDFPVPNTKLSDFADKLLSRWQERRFETAVGNQNGDLRLALNARREMAALAATTSSETTKWLKVIGNPPLRTVMQKALGLPDSFAALDLDKQVTMLRDRAARTFDDGTISQFTNPDKVEDLIRRFLIRADTTSTPQSGALTILTQTRSLLRRI